MVRRTGASGRKTNQISHSVHYATLLFVYFDFLRVSATEDLNSTRAGIRVSEFKLRGGAGESFERKFPRQETVETVDDYDFSVFVMGVDRHRCMIEKMWRCLVVSELGVDRHKRWCALLHDARAVCRASFSRSAHYCIGFYHIE